MNQAISAIFVLEFVIRIIISGFCDFLKGGLFNVFDFFIVVTIILSTGFEIIFSGWEAADDSYHMAKAREIATILGLFKALRPLKFLKLPVLRDTL
jgi:hypothetical protein